MNSNPDESISPFLRKLLSILGAASAFLTLSYPSQSAASDPFELETLADFTDIVWSIDFLPRPAPSRFFLILTQKQSGQIRILDPETKKSFSVKGSPNSVERGQGGLLDIRLGPDFGANQELFLTFTKKSDKGFTTAVGRATLKETTPLNFALANLTEIFEARPSIDAGVHFGSRLAFSANKEIFVSVGDRGDRDLAQNLRAHPGKVLRITREGKPSSENPFFNSKEGLPEIWSYGNRNIQGMTIHPTTGQLFATEHGPKGGDEVNHIQKGKNYGWPIVTYGREYSGPKIGDTHRAGMEQPLTHFTPSIGPSGLAIYSGARYANWKGDFLIGALALTHLKRLSADGKQQIFLEKLSERIREVREGPDGHIYLGTDSGKVLRLRFR